MQIDRRSFLRLSGAGGILLLNSFGKGTALATPRRISLNKRIGETSTICPYCGVGCGVIISVENGRIKNVEGDADHPINQGSLCPKGSALCQIANNERRLTKVLYRSPGATEWEEKTWDWTIDQIARRVKMTRDVNWIGKNEDGQTVNRTEAIASVGSIFPNSEEAYAISKLQRALGMVYIENEARVCVSSAVAANSESFGRGPMSNSWIDLLNSDCIIAIGCNLAETFPIAFKWVTKAKEKGAKLIHVDPRFTRTSAKADIYARIRTGTDIAFIGGMIKWVLDDMERNPTQYNMEYIKKYTNAAFLINSAFEFKDGLFSGYNAAERSYDKSTWEYQTENGMPKMDETLEDTNCVFQLLKKHYSRYDPDNVCKITGASKDVFLEVCRTFAATGAKTRAGALILSSGACEHSHGTQNVRAYGILQLLLGNMGVAGGGINGVAGAVNGLGCTLQGRLNNWLSGTLPPPRDEQQSLAEYVRGGGHSQRLVSLLKAFYGNNATESTDYGFEWLPKRGRDYSWIPLFNAMNSGRIKGLICWGMNPAVSGPNSDATREALGRLDWIVAIDLWETETAAFWKRPGVNPTDIDTEVFLLPAASSLEKEGSVTSSARWMQWRYKGVEPPGQAKDDLWIINKLALKLVDYYVKEGGPNAQGVTKLNWNYGDPPDVHKIAKEINGYELKTGKLLPSFTKLKADGSTSSGNWLFCGSYTEEGNMAARRDPVDTTGIGLFPRWAWSWPLNRRIWYNRASVDLHGRPWDPKHPVIEWDPLVKKWVGDQPDGRWPPVHVSGKYPFVMNKPHRRAHLFGPGRADGPLPEHYEPWESPMPNLLSSQEVNPTCKLWETKEKSSPDKYPIIATTYRLVEHLHTGSFTRNVPWLVELMPEMFVEISEQLALVRGIKNGARVVIQTARNEIRAVAIVTKRLQPFYVDGQPVHQIAMPWSWGYMGLTTGDSTNLLTTRVADPNSMIPEYRAFLCDVRET